MKKKKEEKQELLGTQRQDISKIIERNIEDEMASSYIDYSMSVIVGRALPDVRDGLKPVHRRILYSMKELSLFHNKPFKKAARIVGECFVKGTLVLTSKGLRPIEEVEVGDRVYTQNGIERVKRLYIMPERPLLKVIIENGVFNVSTESQKYKVITRDLRFVWKETRELKKGDFIVIRATYPDIRKEVLLGNFNGRRVFLNKEIAYILGSLISDGWVEKGYNRGKGFRLCFSSGSFSVIRRIKKIFKKEFNYDGKIEKKSQYPFRPCYIFRIHDTKINNFFVKKFSLASIKAETKFVPKEIFSSPKEVIFSFLSGLIDGDGSIHKDRNVIHFGSVSETLIKDTALLFQSIGIVPKRLKTATKTGGIIKGKQISSRFPFLYLEVRGKFAQKLACFLDLASRKKKETLKRMIRRKTSTTKTDMIPFAGEFIFTELTRKHLGGGWYEDKMGKKFRAGIKYKTGCKIRYSSDILKKNLHKSQVIEWGLFEKLQRINSPLMKNLKEILEEDVFFAKVESIEKMHPQETYDLEIENQHEFIANGMVVHNCLGKYHPHGDTAVYDALIRMAQDFSLRYPLVEGQGNVGSVDGDPPAAMRYVEARLKKVSDEMLKDIEKDTVDFMDNFDGSLKEPVVLPSNIPNLLINGSSGIAVGMATNIPPHNLSEIVDALVALIDEPEISDKKLFKIVKGPDFPTGAIITNREGIYKAYKTGRGSIRLKAKAEIQEVKGGREIIVVTELPYQVNKAALIETIANLVRDKKITGISNIRDESDKEGIRVVIEISKDAVAGIVLNQLFKHTQLSTNYGIILLALHNNVPKVLSLREMLGYYLDHRVDVITRRTKFELKKAEERAHILEGLRIALENLDKIIAIIKKSKTPQIAKEQLIKNFKMTERQAQAILDMRLQQLTGLERIKIEEEYKEKIKLIKKLKHILGDPSEVLKIVKEDLLEVKKKYGDERRTEITDEDTTFTEEDLIEDADVVVAVTHQGYIKRVPLSTWRTQGRGGKGVISMKTKEDDYLEYLFITSNLSTFLVFTNLGRVYWLKVWKIPEGSRTSRGKPIVNLLNFKAPGEKVNSFFQIRSLEDACGNLIMISEKGFVKKTPVSEYSRPRSSGIIAIKLSEGDKLVGVSSSSGNSEVIIATQKGKAIRFSEKTARTVGRSARGVRGIKLAPNDRVVGMVVMDEKSSDTLLVVSEKGFGKRTDISAYRKQNRGGKGIINMKITPKTGDVVALLCCNEKDEVMVLTAKGIMIRQKVSQIRKTGRATSGVRLIRLDEGDRVASVGKIASEEIG